VTLTRGPGLPDFPWDSLAEDRALAERHPGGLVDLSVGTPVDPIAPVVRAALAGPAADEPGYPTTHGPASLRRAIAGSLHRRFGVTVDPAAVLPTIGSKELVAWLPTLLGLGRRGAADLVVIPELAYPTYEVGALLAGASAVRADGLTALGPQRPGLVWVNSPSNPTGRVLPPEHLRKVVDWARERGAVVASDECYLSLARDACSVLHPDVSGGTPGRPPGRALDVQVLRARGLPRRLRHRRPRPRRAAAGGAQARRHDRPPARAGRPGGRCGRRRARGRAGRGVRRAARPACAPPWRPPGCASTTPRPASTCGPPRGGPVRSTVREFAGHGVLVAPGEFYGPAGAQHVRVAVTAPDERIDAAVQRLTP
jgi:hypothetical protein